MKNQNRTEIGSSTRRSLSILLIFATLIVTNVSRAADFKNGPAENGTKSATANLTYRGGALYMPQVLLGTGCYTPNGRYQMPVALPLYSYCQINTPFGALFGTVGW